MSHPWPITTPSLRVFLPVGGCFYTPEKNLPFSFYIAQLAQLGPGCVLCGHKKRYVAILGLAAGLWRQMGQEAWASAPWRTNFPPPGAQDNQQAMAHAVGAASRRLPPSCLLAATRRSHPGSSTCIDEKKRQHEVTEVKTLLHCKFLPLRLGWPPWPPLFSTCTSSMQRSRALGVWPVSALLCSADVVLTADRWRRSIPAADSMLCARRWQVPKAAPLLARDNGSARDGRRALISHYGASANVPLCFWFGKN